MMAKPLSLQVRTDDPDNSFATVVESYNEHLQTGRYGHSCRRYVASVVHFGHWLSSEGIAVTTVDEAVIGRFLSEHLPRCECPRPVPLRRIEVRAALNLLLRLMRAQGIAAIPATNDIGREFAIRAARLLDMELRVAGPISNRSWFESEIAPLLGNDIRYVGHLDHTALRELIGGARTVLCTPRWEEPYGLVVAEALACGTPVAAFARGAIPSILDASSGALAAPDDAGALAAAARIALSLNRLDCRRRAERHCDAAEMITGYEDLYRAMLDRSIQSLDSDVLPNCLIAAE